MNNNNSDFRDWLLKHYDEESTDIVLKELLAKSCSSMEQGRVAFEDFSSKVGLKKKRTLIQRSRRALVAAAAAVAVPALILAAVAVNGWRIARDTVWTEKIAQETCVVGLSDGTSVKMKPGSRLVYPSSFCGKERQVFLSGEAYFDVFTNPKRPFKVTAGDLNVIARGTRFNVCSRPDLEDDEVALFEGKVEMSFSDGSGSAFLAPGELFRYNKEEKHSMKCRFAENYFDTVINQNGLQFMDSSFKDIATILSERFGMTVQLDSPSLEKKRYYASFINGEGLAEILDALALNGDFTYKYSSGTVHITER